MKEKRYNEITFTKDNYDDERDMWFDIQDTIRILSNLEYEIQFYCDEKGLGIYCLKFNYRNQEFGCPHIEWVAEDEYVEKEIREDRE